MKRKIAIIGSSGGNLYSLGGKDPKSLLGEIVKQVDAAGMEVAAIQFIGAEASMDFAKKNTAAHMWGWQAGQIEILKSASLEEINVLAKSQDESLASEIENGNIDGLIFVSADPEGVNKLSIESAIKNNIVGVGSGGSSMAKIQAEGVKILGVTGTTGTTNRSRAVSNVYPLAKHWQLKYTPSIGDTSDGNDASGSVFSRISVRGILMAALPGFIAMALTLFISKIPGAPSEFGDVFGLIIGALPVIVAAIAAKQVSGMNEVGIVAGVVAGTLSVSGGLIGGVIGGILAGILVHYLFKKCIEFRFPATTANIVAGGVSGLLAGLVVFFFIGPLALAAGNGIRDLIDLALQYSPILAGALAGLLIWPAIIAGVYHAAILPIVMLEMGQTGNSFLGAIDMCALVMVSAGITLANIVYPRSKSEAAVATPGFLINVFFGTFVEASYPFMFANKIVFGGALFSGMLSGAAIGYFNVRGTAYVPSIIAPSLSNNPFGFLISMVIAVVAAFSITVFANRLGKKRDSKKEISQIEEVA